MPTITCEVSKCYYNKDGGCSRDNIKVGGKGAVVSDETMCEAYTDAKDPSCTNCSCEDGACSCTEIDCSAENCKHNSAGCCKADTIEIGKCSSCCCSETECESFDEK